MKYLKTLDAPRAVLQILVAVSLGGVIPTLLLLQSPSLVEIKLPFIVSSLNLELAAGMLAALIGRGSPRIAQTVFWLFVYISICLAPLSQYSYDDYPNLMDSSYLSATALAQLIGCVSFSLAYGLSKGEKSDRPVRGLQRQLSWRKIDLLSLVSIVLSLYYIEHLGGVASFFSSRRELSLAFGGGAQDSQVLPALIITLGTIPIFAAWTLNSLRLLQNRSVWTPARICLCTILGTLNLIVNNPIVNARYWILTILLAFIFTLFGISTRVYRSVFLGGLLLAIVVFPYSDYFRYAAGQRSFRTDGVFQTLATKDYDQMIMFANGMWWSDRHGFQFGQQLLSSIFFFVPRSVWPDKALDTGVAIGQEMGVSNTNLSSTLWTEGWVDFGIVGVVLFLGLLGVISRQLDDAYLSWERSNAPTRLGRFAAPILAGYMFILLRGPLLQAMSRLSIIVLVLALVSSRDVVDSKADTTKGSE